MLAETLQSQDLTPIHYLIQAPETSVLNGQLCLLYFGFASAIARFSAFFAS